MTYKDIINRFRSITEAHLMLEDFGYGDLSDLKYVSQLGSEEERVSYPYLYLLPSSSTRNGPVMNYAFNMIVMDMARPEDGAGTDKFDNYITIQSQCQQYIDDVLANLYYFYKDKPEIQLTGITYTPFKEKYQDVVAGMTATINIAVPTPLNECIAPFFTFPDPVGQLQLHVVSNADQQFLPDDQQSPFEARTVILDTQNGWRPDEPFNFYTPQVNGTWTWVLEGETRLTLDQGDWPSNPEMVYNYNGQIVPVSVTTWPQVQPPLGVDTPFKAMWQSESYTADGNFITWNWLNDPVVEDEFLILAGTSLKGYFTPA